MKKFFAMMVVAAFAITFTTQAVLTQSTPTDPPGPLAPYANNPYFTNIDARGDVYWGYTKNWIKDYVHGKPGNPHKSFNYLNHTSGTVTTGSWTASPYIQFDQYGDFMWQTGTKNLTQPTPVTQLDLPNCVWYDYPEYVGCTEYFYLFVYRPLDIYCICQDYYCLGIFTIPSYHDLYTNLNMYPGTNKAFYCEWILKGQTSWYIVLSGEIIYKNPGGGVDIDWQWYGSYLPLSTNWPPAGPNTFIEDNDNWHKLIQLSNGDPGFYNVGLLAKSVSVNHGATPGVHSWEATLSGFYYF